MRRQMGEVGDLDEFVADLRAEGPDFLMRTAQEFVQHPEFVHDLEGRGMDRVAAEIAQEIGMLFEDQHGTPARASSRASIMPAGPPPAMQQRTEISLFVIDVP